MPDDGRPLLATGIVRPLSTPLTAPLSGTPCVSYVYRMYFVQHRVTAPGPDRDIVVVAWGYASRPFALDGPARRVPILAVPRLECPPTQPSGDRAVARAREFLSTTAFETTAARPLGPLAAAFEQFRETLTVEDAEVRRDWKREGTEVDPADLSLEEIVLPIDIEASVHGPWSSDRHAIVAPGTLLAETHVVAVLGRPEKQLDALAVERSTTAYVVAAIVLMALGAAVIWFGNILPSLR
jgi:hypothetical protein